MKTIEQLENEYIERFDGMFPNISLDETKEREIILKCLEEDKDAYELGFFTLENNVLY